LLIKIDHREIQLKRVESSNKSEKVKAKEKGPSALPTKEEKNK